MSFQPTIFADMESGPAVWIRVEGKGTFQNSPGLKDFSRRMIETGKRAFVVDLQRCPAMDSTFMGTLALFSECPAPESIVGAGDAIAHTADKATTREVMREAHEACVEVNPKNAAHFRDVLDFLNASAAKDAAK